MADLRRILGANVRYHRDLLGLTQARVAELADMTLNYLGYIERGLKWPSAEKLDALSFALQTTPDVLLKTPSGEDPVLATIERFRTRIKDAVDSITEDFVSR